MNQKEKLQKLENELLLLAAKQIRLKTQIFALRQLIEKGKSDRALIQK